MVTRVYLTSELPALKTVIAGLEQLIADKITCEYLEDDKGLVFGAEVSNEIADDAFTLLQSVKEGSFYETWRSISAHHNYLVDATVVILQALGGTYEHASSLPAAAQQPWRLAKE